MTKSTHHLMYHSVPGKTSIVYNDVDLPSSEFSGSLDELVDVLRIKHIPRYGFGIPRRVIDLSRNSTSFVGIDVLDDYFCTLSRKEFGSFCANALT